MKDLAARGRSWRPRKRGDKGLQRKVVLEKRRKAYAARMNFPREERKGGGIE